jgi:hypothetical protein
MESANGNQLLFLISKPRPVQAWQDYNVFFLTGSECLKVQLPSAHLPTRYLLLLPGEDLRSTRMFNELADAFQAGKQLKGSDSFCSRSRILGNGPQLQ